MNEEFRVTANESAAFWFVGRVGLIPENETRKRRDESAATPCLK
jgi:hypothetical protein